MFSLFGENFVKTNVTAGSDEGVIAAADKNGAQALVYYFNEFDAQRKLHDREYLLRFEGLANGKYLLQTYSLDDTHNNTYRLWERMGKPQHPTEQQLSLLHNEQDLSLDFEQEIVVENGEFDYSFVLSSVSMKLVTLKKL